MTQPLDLYGTPRPIIRRPGLAALGCWCFVFNSALVLFMLAIYWIPTLLGLPRASWLRLGIALLQCVLTVSALAGTLLVGFANIAGKAMNPWPRLLAMILTFAAVLLAIPANAMAINLAAGGSGPIPLYYLLRLGVGACQIATYIASLLYVLQLAKWLRSNSLRISGSITYAAGILTSTVGFLLMGYAVVITQGFGSGAKPSTVWFVWSVATILESLTGVAFATFFGVVALRLQRVSGMAAI